MGLDNSDSEYDGSLSSCDDWKPKNAVKSPSSVVEGDVEDRLKAVLQLKAELHIEEDPEYVSKEARKEAKKQEIRIEAEQEKMALNDLSLEDKIETQSASVESMMEKIRQKRENSQKNLMADSGKGRRRVQRTLSSASAASTASECSHASNLSDIELSEFQRLKAKKALRKKRRSSKKVDVPPKEK